jgi:hypothetical protein
MQGLVWRVTGLTQGNVACQVLQQANSDSSEGENNQCSKNALYMQASCPLSASATGYSPLLQTKPALPVSLAAVRAALGCEQRQLLA